MIMPAAETGDAPADPMALLKTRGYVQLLVIAAIIGVPVSAIAYGFLKLVSLLQLWLFETLPKAIGFAGTPVWWPLPLLAVAGLLVGLTITYLPGTGGHVPAEGFKASGAPTAAELPGIFLAALATLSLGVVLGPEAPLIAIGGGLGLVSVRLAKRDAPPTASIVIAAAGGFAAISALFGSPILGAFLLMEASGLGGPMMALVLVPGLLAAGIGTLVFVGLNSLTGFGTFSLSIPGLPPFAHPTVAMFGWAIVFGLAAAVLGTGIRLMALSLNAIVERRAVLLTPVAGLAVAGMAIAFAEGTGRGGTEVLFSGQSALPGLVVHAAGWTVGALVLLVVCKSIAYGVSLSSFRGGPVFPSMFIGAAAGVAASHLPGLSLVPGVAMGIGAMCTVMLGLPMTSTLLATLLLASDGLNVISVVIVAVVVAYVATAWVPQTPAELTGWRSAAAGDAPRPAPAPATAAAGATQRSGSPVGG
jgi:H+/Cl- antiporter ClcA